MSTAAIDVLDTINAQRKDDTAQAAARYREIILAGGPTAEQAGEIATLIDVLGYTTDDVKADVRDVAEMRRKERSEVEDRTVGKLRVALEEAHKALVEWHDHKFKREQELMVARSSAEMNLQRANDSNREASEARKVITRNPRLVAKVEPLPPAPFSQVCPPCNDGPGFVRVYHAPRNASPTAAESPLPEPTVTYLQRNVTTHATA